MKPSPRLLGGTFALFLSLLSAISLHAADTLQWDELSPLPSELGVAGPFTGIHENHLIVAGGANFPEPVWENEKAWRDTIYALPLDEKDASWKVVGKLPRPIGYGSCISLTEGIVCIGGNDADQSYADVFLLKWENGSVSIEELPKIPNTLCYGSATVIDSSIYLAGGSTGHGLETAQKNFWKLDWSKRSDVENFAWEQLEAWPGPSRALNSTVTQNNGENDCIYVIGGRRIGNDGQIEFLNDVYEFNPAKPESPWRKRANLRYPRMAGTAVAIGQNHISLLAGDDGSLFTKADELRDAHPGFTKTILTYHTITDTWIEDGQMPQNQVTTHAVPWGDDILLASGEVRPRVRTRDVWKVSLLKSESDFPLGNWVAIVLYLGAVMGIAFYFARRNKGTDDFFRGGQRVPGWVAGLSIFATMLSSITFIAVPARAFATDWSFIILNVGILICAPLVVYGIIPHFRKINATSAYEYLEQRFNLAIRLFASGSFVLFQIGRMAIVMYLPGLALAAITPLSLEACIIIMGGLSILYCAIGGLEAVVWTDALQAIVLLGGAFLCFALIISGLDGGFGELKSIAAADRKLNWADMNFSSASYMTTAFWVVVLGGLGSSLIPYSSDQAVVQRYVSTPTEKAAQGAVWLNAGMSAVASLLFFALGTALYAFYKTHPESLDPTFKTDSIFPLFISRELPIGIAGILIAAVFAAAQSTISTSMNSTATAIVTDFVHRLGWQAPESSYLRLARILTVALGGLGTTFALVLAWSDIESALKTFLTIIGFAMGPLCGIFVLGMFTKSANARGAVIGAICGVAILLWARYFTTMSGLLYAPLGIIASFTIGLIASRK
ncbi:MAG: sodium/solute symporter [Opitutales bacterium]|nr:sodium/solute symporter [Opitutales bacterium]